MSGRQLPGLSDGPTKRMASASRHLPRSVYDCPLIECRPNKWRSLTIKCKFIFLLLISKENHSSKYFKVHSFYQSSIIPLHASSPFPPTFLPLQWNVHLLFPIYTGLALTTKDDKIIVFSKLCLSFFRLRSSEIGNHARNRAVIS